MKILLISQIPTVFEKSKKKTEVFPYFQPQASWVKALRVLKHQVKVFRYTDSYLFPNKLRITLHTFLQNNYPLVYNKWRLLINRGYQYVPENWIRSIKLHQIINDFAPDRIIVSGGISELLTFPFETAKKQGIALYLLHGINPKTDSTTFEKGNVELFDWVITNDQTHAEEWLKFGARQAYCLPISAINPQIHRKKRLTKAQKQAFQSQVVFVGTLFPDRQKWLRQLINNDWKLKVYGHIPPGLYLYPTLKAVYQGEAWGEKVIAIFNAAKLVLNFVPPHMPVGGNLRTFEIPGCGALQLANRCPDKWFKANKEIVIFKNLKDLKRKINYYLTHEKQRKQIAQAGHARVLKEHAYKHRFRKLLNLPV